MKTVIFFAIIFITFLSAEAYGQESFITSNNNLSLSYSLIGKVEKNMGHAEGWIKMINTNNPASKNNLSNFRQNKIEIRTRFNKSVEGYDKYLYSMNLYQVDCKSNKFRVVETDDYDADGKILSKEKTPDAEWVDIAGSIYVSIGKVICSN